MVLPAGVCNRVGHTPTAAHPIQHSVVKPSGSGLTSLDRVHTEAENTYRCGKPRGSPLFASDFVTSRGRVLFMSLLSTLVGRDSLKREKLKEPTHTSPKLILTWNL